MISAFGKAGLLSVADQAVDVIAVEMRDDHDVDRVASMPAAFRLL